MSLLYMVNFGPLAAEIVSLVGHHCKFQLVSRLGSVTARHLVVGLWASAKLCGVERRAPPMFDRVTIRLGIGPHSSCFFFSVHQFFRFSSYRFTDPPLSLTTLFTLSLPSRSITDLIMYFLYHLFFLLALSSFLHHSFMSSSTDHSNVSHPMPYRTCLLYTSPSPRDRQKSRMPSSA